MSVRNPTFREALPGLLLMLILALAIVGGCMWLLSDKEDIASPVATATATPRVVNTPFVINYLEPGTITFDAYLTPRPTLVPTPTPIARPTPPGVSRQQVGRAIQSLDIGFLPLNRHTDDFYSMMLPNGDVIIDIFGTANHVEAVEATYRLTAADAGALVTGAVLQLMLPEGQWDAGWDWLDRAFDDLSASRTKVQTRIGDKYLTLYFIPRLASVMFSIDEDQL